MQNIKTAVKRSEVEVHEKKKSSIFLSLVTVIRTNYLTPDIRVLHAAQTLPTLKHCNTVCAGDAWRWRAVCRWPTSNLEK